MNKTDRKAGDSKRLSDKKAAEIVGAFMAEGAKSPQFAARAWGESIRLNPAKYLGDILRVVEDRGAEFGEVFRWRLMVSEMKDIDKMTGHDLLRIGLLLAATDPKAVIRAVAAAIEEEKSDGA